MWIKLYSAVFSSVLDYTIDIGELSEKHKVSVVLTGDKFYPRQ